MELILKDQTLYTACIYTDARIGIKSLFLIGIKSLFYTTVLFFIFQIELKWSLSLNQLMCYSLSYLIFFKLL